MVNKKKKKISARIPLRLYDEIIKKLSPLFEYNESAVIVHILKNYLYSEDYEVQLIKLSRAHFVALLREEKIRQKIEELHKK